MRVNSGSHLSIEIEMMLVDGKAVFWEAGEDEGVSLPALILFRTIVKKTHCLSARRPVYFSEILIIQRLFEHDVCPGTIYKIQIKDYFSQHKNNIFIL